MLFKNMDQNKHENHREQMAFFHPLTKAANNKSATKTNNGKGKHVCDECGRRFRVPSFLKTHVDAVHLKLKPYKCEDCDFVVSDPSVLRRHVTRVHYHVIHQCNFCNYSSGYSNNITRHTKAKHQNAGKLK